MSDHVLYRYISRNHPSLKNKTSGWELEELLQENDKNGIMIISNNTATK
jgi:succinate dehydrogenase flavin-adding protein (antitoxin of CptAB toxin-antitoxin module)